MEAAPTSYCLDTISSASSAGASLRVVTAWTSLRNLATEVTENTEKFAARGRAGQVAALVGLSGAGKTTLVNLIPRFFDVKEGALLIDGVDVRDVTLKSLRDQVVARLEALLA